MTTIHLQWTANPAAELVTEYRVFESFNLGAFDLKYTVNTPSLDIIDPPAGQYAWRIKAVNFVGVSPDSATLSGPGIPSAPTGGTVTVTVS